MNEEYARQHEKALNAISARVLERTGILCPIEPAEKNSFDPSIWAHPRPTFCVPAFSRDVCVYIDDRNLLAKVSWGSSSSNMPMPGEAMLYAEEIRRAAVAASVWNEEMQKHRHLFRES